MFQVVSTLFVVTSVTPTVAAIFIPILYYYKIQQDYFSQSYRELKRIDSVTRSPIYALFGETLDGPSTIRAFGAQNNISRRMSGMIDRQQHAFYLTQGGLCWLAVRLELIGTAIIFATCIAAVVEKKKNPDDDDVFAGLAGLSISYALAVTQSLNWAVRVGSDFEANMVSVERIRQYCNLDREAPHETCADAKCDDDWPSNGVIEFKDVKMRYRPGLPLVLKGLDLRIPGHSKVGIVGRTGMYKIHERTSICRNSD
jgi:ATP-binding cassette subfamily C (CFTR/MRP) protein 1